MSANDKLAGAVVIIYIIWFCVYTISTDLLKNLQSYYVFKNAKYGRFDRIYKFIFQKKYNEKDEIYISELKVKINTYISKYKYNNKSSLDTMITIIMTILTTLTITGYTIQSQSQNSKEIVTLIIKNLGDDFATAFFVVFIIYGVKGIINEFIKSKFEYYLMVKNIIDEIEKKEKEKSKQLILELKEIKELLKYNNEDKVIISKACNKIINDIF